MFSSQQMLLWEYVGMSVFPLHFGAADRSPDNAWVKRFPRAIKSDSLVSRCKSGWIRVAPGSGVESDAHGYIQLDVAGRRLAVYHLWGEI
jgi:hypothetical protein